MPEWNPPNAGQSAGFGLNEKREKRERVFGK
jgi:hypothetical protein